MCGETQKRLATLAEASRATVLIVRAVRMKVYRCVGFAVFTRQMLRMLGA